MADMNKYIHGQQTYRLTYTQRDVTRFFADTNSDEFYWDTNGTAWKVPISQLNISLTIDSSLLPHLSGNQSCYVGAEKSTDRCDLTQDGTTYSVSADSLSPGQNVTLSIGFNPETFSPYVETMLEKLFRYWLVLQAALTLIAIALLIWAIVRFYNTINRLKEMKPIAPEYLPPKDYSVTLSSQFGSDIRPSRQAFYQDI